MRLYEEVATIQFLIKIYSDFKHKRIEISIEVVFEAVRLHFEIAHHLRAELFAGRSACQRLLIGARVARKCAIYAPSRRSPRTWRTRATGRSLAAESPQAPLHLPKDPKTKIRPPGLGIGSERREEASEESGSPHP
jgi:hypothetical protein